MNKIISFVLLGALLLMCFSGCSNPNINGDDNKTDSGGNSALDGTEDNKEPENEDENNKVELNDELNDLFAKLQEDSEKTEKISFSIQYQDLHYELKASDKYINEEWFPPLIIVTVNCNYALATDEDWYKACSNTDIKTLNIALFNEYSQELSEGHFSPLAIAPALYFDYVHSESTLSETLNVFYSDYAVLQQLIDLEYVTGISILYFYAVPGSYFDE